jgi:hypothetical protein
MIQGREIPQDSRETDIPGRGELIEKKEHQHQDKSQYRRDNLVFS